MNYELQIAKLGPVPGDRESRITNPRYEVKIPLPVHWLPDVEAWVRLHPAQWRVAYPPRQVNNVYFDTAAFDGLNANLGGVGERAKLRLRWYGDDLARVADANLELKRKQGAVGWKDIAPVSGELALSRQTWSAFGRALRTVVAPQARCWLDVYAVPVLVNHYRRAYFVTPDGVLRLTIDTALYAYNQRASAFPNLRQPVNQDAMIVVELKAPTEAARRLSTVLTHFPVPVDRFSKYVQGVIVAPDF